MLGNVDRRQIARVPAGLHTENTVDGEAGTRRDQPQLPGCVARRPEVKGAFTSVGGAHDRALVVDTGIGVEVLVRLEVPHYEIRRERAQREPAAGSQRRGESSNDAELAVAASEQAEPSLAQTDDRVERVGVRQLPHVGLVELDRKKTGLGPGEREKVG